MKKTNGITLVSLVITIIVLLILAGITISLTIGQDGIITRTQESAKKQELAEIKEKIGLDILEAEMEAKLRKESLEESQLKDIISNYGELQDDGDTIILKDNKGNLSLLDIYNGTTVSEGSYSDNKEKIESLEKQLEESSKKEAELQQQVEELKNTLASQEITSTLVATGYVGGGGAITRKATVTHDLSSYEGFEDFEVNKNIFLVSTYARFSEDADGYHSATCNVSITYDKTTGKLTLTDTAYRLAIYYSLYIVY